MRERELFTLYRIAEVSKFSYSSKLNNSCITAFAKANRCLTALSCY